jgi:hypothetical protein
VRALKKPPTAKSGGFFVALSARPNWGQSFYLQLLATIQIGVRAFSCNNLPAFIEAAREPPLATKIPVNSRTFGPRFSVFEMFQLKALTPVLNVAAKSSDPGWGSAALRSVLLALLESPSFGPGPLFTFKECI